MKKIVLTAFALACAAVALTGCNEKKSAATTATTTAVAEENAGGKVLNIYVWNEEFQDFYQNRYAYSPHTTENYDTAPSCRCR